jgi:hypothetical protein
VKLACFVLFSLGAVVILPLFYIENTNSEILIESIESKTSAGKKIFNKIKLTSTSTKDVWEMKQNYSKLHGSWDQLKIEVDKTSKPFKASYFQYKDGVESNYRVACYKCHANGPRAIRANYKSKLVENTYLEKLKITLWNLKIKHYGEIETPQDIKLKTKYRKVPLKYIGRKDMKVIASKTCDLCHGDQSYMGRKQLVYQQKTTIKHLILNGEMSPWPLSLSAIEKEELLQNLL